ncbi:MAG TPA: hypothetical protein V6D03_07700 [Candidatus Caenarcaniphilales bacterium]
MTDKNQADFKRFLSSILRVVRLKNEGVFTEPCAGRFNPWGVRDRTP